MTEAYVQATEFAGFKRDMHPVCEVELMSKLGLMPWDKVRDIPENKLLCATTMAVHWDAMQQRAIFSHGDRQNENTGIGVRYRTGRTWRMLVQAVITASAGCRVHIAAGSRDYTRDLHTLATRWAEQLGVPTKLISCGSRMSPTGIAWRSELASVILIAWLRKGAEDDAAFCAHRALGSDWFQYKLVELDSLLESEPNEEYALAKLRRLHPNDMFPQPSNPVHVDHSCGLLALGQAESVANELRERILATSEVQEAINVLTYNAAGGARSNPMMWLPLAELREHLQPAAMDAIRRETHVIVTEDQASVQMLDHYTITARLNMGCDQHCRLNYESRAERSALEYDMTGTISRMLDELAHNLGLALAEHLVQPGHFSHLKRLLQHDVEMLYNAPLFPEQEPSLR